MPKRQDIKSILIIGAGPIVIGQACEFDYSGAQACKALREEGYRVILVNSNPATIMTALGSRQFEKPFRAISLCDNQAVITAIANDDGYENIFLQQLQTLATAGDTIVCISASGNSKNLIKAIEYARENSIYVVGLTAFDGGYLKENCDLNIHVPTKIGEYGPAEDLHMVICGLVGSYFRAKFLNA